MSRSLLRVIAVYSSSRVSSRDSGGGKITLTESTLGAVLARTNEAMTLSDEHCPSAYVDGDRSLVRVDLLGLADDPGSWQLSCEKGGTPGRLPGKAPTRPGGSLLPRAGRWLGAASLPWG